MYNVGYEAQISQVCHAYVQDDLKLTVANSQSLFILKHFIARGVKPTSDADVQQALTLNLSKNSRELRIATLKVLSMFEPEEYLTPQEGHKYDLDTIKNFYTGPCQILGFMLKAEECQISLDTEKTKSNLLRRVSLMLQSDLVPSLYVTVCYRFAIGCFWVKFAPLYT